MNYIIGTKALAKELNVSLTTAKHLTKRPDFPVIRQDGIRILTFDKDACKDWWKENHLDLYRQKIQNEGSMIVTDFAKLLGVSISYIMYLVEEKGLKSKKIKRSRIIELDDARLFFISQSDRRIQAYAKKIPNK
jgi:hypothetical protein